MCASLNEDINGPVIEGNFLAPVLFHSVHQEPEKQLCFRSVQALYDPMDYSLSGSFVRWILQARILE